MARSTIKATAAAAALHFILITWIGFCKNAMLYPSASAFAAGSAATTNGVVRPRRGATSRARLNSFRREDAPPSQPTATATTTTRSYFWIREAKYSDLAQAAELMTDGFHPDLRKNPILRPVRYLMELDRMQGNFPYEENDRHFYLAVYDEEVGGSATTPTNGSGRLIGFCDVDGRVPAAGFSLSPFRPNVQRPQPYFSDLAVHPDFRRRGVASALMAEAERRAREMGFDELYLGVRSTNELALRMYSRLGYESVVPSGDMLAFLDMQKDVRMLRRSLDKI